MPRYVCWKAAMLSVLIFQVGTNASTIPVADLLSHASLLENTTPSSQSNFELGLTYQLLAESLQSNNAAVDDHPPLSLGFDALLMRAQEYYNRSLAEKPRNAHALSNLAHLSEYSHGLSDESITNILELTTRQYRLSPFSKVHPKRLHDAAAIFNRGMRSHPDSIALRFELAFTIELLGDEETATSMYEDILAHHPSYTNALLNLAALRQKRFALEDAIAIYSTALSTLAPYQSNCFYQEQSANESLSTIRSPFTGYDSNNGLCVCPPSDDVALLSKILNNKGLALQHQGRYTEAVECFEEVIALLHACDAGTKRMPSKQLLTTAAHLFICARAGSFLGAWDWLDSLLEYIETLELEPAKLLANKQTHNQVIRLGFMSHDFGNHPTTFLFEGIAAVHAGSSPVEIVAYSYGADDGSRSRARLVDRLGNNFFDISSVSHDDASRVICENRSHIMFDMQGYTLGARPQLMRNTCSDIYVSYLAFPGTSGASFIDYIVVDRHVARIEHSEDDFTEKLAVLPRSYQANYFNWSIEVPDRGSDEWKELREKEGLSTSTSVFVFANLNKQDKLDPTSFSTMLTCLAKVPGSVLWLLAPSGSAGSGIVKRNLFASARKRGISPDRLIFAKKVGRDDHIKRMAAGDLFLDTFLYGAHTTATDALRGGMPLLTLAGDSFSNRVGVSLLHGMNSKRAPSLIAYTIEEFVDVAVEVAAAQRRDAATVHPTTKSVGTKFIEPDDYHEHQLFDYESYSNDLVDLATMMLEVKWLSSKNMHIVMANN
ncbi:hypothetical protein ACHAWF_017759 [Thalassiosira exigua]